MTLDGQSNELTSIFKVVVHTSDMLDITQQPYQIKNHVSLKTSCLVILFNPFELCSIAMHYIFVNRPMGVMHSECQWTTETFREKS